jgi:hypothetical protein
MRFFCIVFRVNDICVQNSISFSDTHWAFWARHVSPLQAKWRQAIPEKNISSAFDVAVQIVDLVLASSGDTWFVFGSLVHAGSRLILAYELHLEE